MTLQENDIQLAVIDMAGTTVADDGLVVEAFEVAAEAGGLPADGPHRDHARRYVLDTMGQSKIAVFRALFEDEAAAQRANAAFETAYAELVDAGRAAPIDGAVQALSRLRQAGVKVALTTGFSATTQDTLISALGWHDVADLVLAPGEGIRGRPYPDLILAALLRTGADRVQAVAALGDTTSDVESALRAGCGIAAGTLTGAHDERRLVAAGATHIVTSVTDFADLLLKG
ncbi:phosphonatase-like hydrolase [Mycobacterium sp. smrl_JER01]|uniref:phosphonatase-like hydrolase n=1 Tax=Mycobacterium sp. smrl_JER01 TaxID=3402633 RepID=UPI003AC9F466